MASQIKLRRDTAANWTAANPVLGAGEPGYDTTNGKLKIGNGSTAWNSLSYFDDKVTDFSSVAANIIPDADNTRDLGAPDKQWRDIYVSNGSIYIGDIKLSNDDGQLVVQQVTDPGLVTEEPVPDTPGSVTTDRLVNGVNTFALNNDGTVELNGQPFTGGGGADTGDITFDGNTIGSTSDIIQTRTQTDNYYSVTYQEPRHWEAYIENNVDGVNPAWAWIYADLDDGVNSPEVFIETKPGDTGVEKRWTFDGQGILTLPANGDIVNSNGDSVLGLNTGQLSGLKLTGKIPTKIDLLSEESEVWIRPNNNEGAVANIAPGIVLKRKTSGGAIYNSYNNVETSSNNDVSPVGTLWNADGWGDLADVQARTYTTFYRACSENVGQNVVGREFVMHDTINDQYFKVEFTFWQPASGGGAGQQVNEKGGLTMVYTPITLTSVTYFVRGQNDTNLGDAVGPGLTIKRGNGGALYNSEEEAEWDPDNTPTGTLWNAEHEWREFSDITALTWKPLYAALHGYLGNKIVGAKLLMWDTINDKYYTVKFTDWGINNGGSFAYVRREILPATGNRTGIVFADGSYQDTATTLGDLKVVDNNVIINQAQPGYGAEIRSDVKSNFTYGTWAWTGTANWVTNGSQGYIQFDNGDVNNGNQVDFANFLGDLGRWYTKTVRINDGEPQIITSWNSNTIWTEAPPATDPTEVTEVRFDVVFRSRMYMGGENTVGFFLNDRDETFEVQARDVNLYGDDDVRIRGKDFMEIRNNGTDSQSYVQIVTNGSNTSKTWRFMPDGSLKLPSQQNTGYYYNYELNGPTLLLGGENDPTEQIIITGPKPNENFVSARRLVIQGQRGYGTWADANGAGEGGDVYIWGGVGGESQGNNGGSGGDIKVRGGQGQNNQGGYVKIEGGSAADWNGGSHTGGYVEISGGDATGGGNGNGGDVRLRGGKKQNTGNNGQVYIYTGSGDEFEWRFDNGGSLSVPGNITSGDSLGLAAADAVDISSNSSGSAKTWSFDEEGVLHLPSGGDIVDSNGNTVLGAALDTNIWVETFVTDDASDLVETATSVEYDADGNVIALFLHRNTDDNSTYISVAKFDTSGSKLWQVRGSSGFYSNGWGLAVDSQSIYVAGTLDGGGSPAAYQVSALLKLNTANGNIIWVKNYDFGEASINNVVDVASDGHPVMVGHAYSGGQAYISTTKIDKDTGSIIWSRKLNGQNGEYAYGMAVGPSGEIVVVGYVDNIGVLGAAASLYSEPESNANWVTNTGGLGGGVNFAVTFTDGYPNFTSITDSIGNRSVGESIGVFNGAGFGGTTPADDMTIKIGSVTAGDEYDKMIVIKYDSTGSIVFQKAIEFDAGFDCYGSDADIDADGNIYVCGNYRQENGVGGTRSCMSILKLNGAGVKQWSRRVVGDCDDYTTSIVVGPDNCLYLSAMTGNNAASDYSFVIAKFSITGQVLWQRLLDNTTTWTFGLAFFNAGGGSNIAVKNGYVAISGTYGDPGTPAQAFIAQISGSGTLFTTGDWDFKGASFSGLLNNTASDLTVTDAGKADSDNSGDITTGNPTVSTDNTNFLIPTKYVLSIALGDLTVLNNILRGTGSAYGDNGLYLAPGPDLAANMYFRVRGGDSPTHLHFDTGNNTTYDQYWGDDAKYLKLGANGNVYIGTWDPMVGGETWTFNNDRTTTIPGALIQGTAAQTYIATPVALNVKLGVNKLADGSYTLADGVEGQVMYLVPQTGVLPANVSVVVANYRIGGTADVGGLLYPFRIFNDANASYYDSRAFCTLIFTDGAWQQSGGSWD